MWAPEPPKEGTAIGIEVEYLWLQPFIEEIINAFTLKGFCMPKIDSYNAL